jgi:hypothetical protein
MVLLALPFRYRYEINCARKATPAPAHYEFVDERFQPVYSRPDQGLNVCLGPGRTGVNRV